MDAVCICACDSATPRVRNTFAFIEHNRSHSVRITFHVRPNRPVNMPLSNSHPGYQSNCSSFGTTFVYDATFGQTSNRYILQCQFRRWLPTKTELATKNTHCLRPPGVQIRLGYTTLTFPTLRKFKTRCRHSHYLRSQTSPCTDKPLRSHINA